MEIYKNQAEVEADIIDSVLTIEGDVSFEFNLKIEASIIVKAGNIKAGDIKAWNIEAGDIKARKIEAWNIEAGDISFYSVCWSYISLKCKSIVGRREKSKYFCIDKEVEYEI